MITGQKNKKGKYNFAMYIFKTSKTLDEALHINLYKKTLAGVAQWIEYWTAN